MRGEVETGEFAIPPRPVVGIVGGLGRMGRWLQRRLQDCGHRVLIADSRGRAPDREFVQASQVLVLALPLDRIAPLMEDMGAHTRPDGLVVDIASLKEEPLRAMLARARGAVVGTHPLFGPFTPDPAGQNVFICPGRGRAWLEWVQNLVSAAGARPVIITPREHDRLMARVQTLRHLALYGLGRALGEMGFDPERDLELAGPWFQELFCMLRRQLRQPARLYAGLALANPEGARAARALARSLEEMARALEAGDRESLEAGMGRVENFLSPPGGSA